MNSTGGCAIVCCGCVPDHSPVHSFTIPYYSHVYILILDTSVSVSSRILETKLRMKSSHC